jgi:hypothetical protein
MRHSRKLAGAVDAEKLDAMAKVVDDAGGDPEHPRTRRQLLKLAGAAALGGAGLVVAGANSASAATGDTLHVGDQGTTSTTNGVALALAGAGTGTDLKLNGTGRLSQAAAPGTANGAQPSVGSYFWDLARGQNGEVWAGGNAWHRINAVRVDNPTGDGSPFTPFRLIDTRAGASHVGPLNGPFGSGSTQTVDVTGSANIPDDCVAIFGNLTAVFPTYSGWLTIYPSSLVSPPVVSNVNFAAGGVFPNSVFVGLSGGSCKVYLGAGGGQSGSTNFILDIFGYVQ